MKSLSVIKTNIVFLLLVTLLSSCIKKEENYQREKISINQDWQFFIYLKSSEADNLIYDARPDDNMMMLK